VMNGKVDAILLTGGLVRFDDIVSMIKEKCGWIAPVNVFPGEAEQEVLAEEALKVANGQAKANIYTGRPVWQPLKEG